VLGETSTGVLNPLRELRSLCSQLRADLCLDAVSAIGLFPVDLAGVRFATAVSGKGLAAFPGIAAVLHDGRPADSREVPRYLDLAAYDRCDGVPFTHSSNLVGALSCSLRTTDWPAKFARVDAQSRALRAALDAAGLAPLAADSCAMPGVITLPISADRAAIDVARRLSAQGIDLACQSGYLRERNWLQVSLMGEIDEVALRRLPAALAEATGARRHVQPASPRAVGRSIDTPLAHPAR
jgi:aspartate aminotransferase-like enzyme